MLKKTSKKEKEKIDDESTKFSLSDLKNNDDNEYTYVSDQNAFAEILKQKADKIHRKSSQTKASMSYRFATNEARQIAEKVYDQNIENQYATNETMIIDFVERFLKSDAETDKELIIFQKKKKKKKKEDQHKNLH